MYTTHATDRPAHLAAVPADQPAHVVRSCACGWQIVRPPGAEAEMEVAAHQVTHATEAERRRIGLVVMALKGHFAALGGDLPVRLVVQTVHQTMSAGVEGVAA